MNQSYEAAGGEGIAEFGKLVCASFRLILLFCRHLGSNPTIVMTVGIPIVLLITFVVGRMERRRRTSKRVAGNDDDY